MTTEYEQSSNLDIYADAIKVADDLVVPDEIVLLEEAKNQIDAFKQKRWWEANSPYEGAKAVLRAQHQIDESQKMVELIEEAEELGYKVQSSFVIDDRARLVTDQWIFIGYDHGNRGFSVSHKTIESLPLEPEYGEIIKEMLDTGVLYQAFRDEERELVAANNETSVSEPTQISGYGAINKLIDLKIFETVGGSGVDICRQGLNYRSVMDERKAANP